VTSARSPALVVDNTIKGRHGGITGHAADRRAIETNEAQLLTLRHHFLKLEQIQVKQVWHKQMINAICILGGHQLRTKEFIFQDPDQVILDEARMQETHIRSIQNQNFIKKSYYTLV
jgi:hypothetical protein